VSAWTIRLARHGDGEGLASLHLDTARSYVALDVTRFRMPDTDGLAAWIDDDLSTMGEGWVCFVAVDRDIIVGQVEARLLPPMDTARYQAVSILGSVRGYVNSLGVASAHRRLGIGRALMEHAERWLAERGAVAVELDTLATSPDSVPFYEAIGYRPNKLIFERGL
jgi:ribosomal protein S18 acetylase RimI-like enzyme